VTVWKEKDRAAWRYRFYYQGHKYEGSTGQLTEQDAIDFEEEEQRKVRRQVHGLGVAPEHSPRISDWAATYYTYLQEQREVRRLDAVDVLLRVVLRFWGAKPSGKDPKNPAIQGEPYHDLRLGDPIRDPDWIEKFEAWIRRRGSSRQSRLHYMSIMSRMYRVAMLPRFAKLTGVQSNPFLTVERKRPPGRKVAVTPAQLRAWLKHAPRHAQLAMAIAALAPKLRLANILQLRWDTSFDEQMRFITVTDHKTVGVTGAPLVVAIPRQLRALLRAAKRDSTGPWVIAYRGEPVKSIRASVKKGAAAADLAYGRAVAGGVTFHTIRHTAATLLAEVKGLTEAERAATMGQDIETTQRYTHLRPESQRQVLTRLGDRLRLDDILDEAFGGPGGKPGVQGRTRAKKPQQRRTFRKSAAKASKSRSGR
jgi:integrase